MRTRGRRQIWWWLRRRQKDAELTEELAFHLDEEARERRDDGLSHREAHRAARIDLGNLTLVREDARAVWSWTLLEQVTQDLRHAVRALRRSPGFALVATATLALGIGVNTAIFSVINAALLRPLPYRDPASLVLIQTSPLVLAPRWLTAAWRDRSQTLSEFGGFNGPRPATLVRGGASKPVDVADVTGNLLAVLGVSPSLGRDFEPADTQQPQAVGLLAHDFWQGALGGDASVIGQTLSINGVPLTIVGVTPRGFLFPAVGSLPASGMPMNTQPDVLRLANPSAPINAIGRLAPGHTAASASTELAGIFKQAAVTEFRREAIDRLELHASSLHERLVGSARSRLWLVMGAVGFVLLVACANVAHLLLARTTSRQREIAVRMALGASRTRVARFVMAESLLLALLGLGGALLLAQGVRGLARTLLADRLSHLGTIPIDGSVLAFSAGVAMGTGVLCGLIALPSVRRVSLSTIASRGFAVTQRNRLQHVLLSAETAVTFVLVVGAALFVQTFWNLNGQPRGFDADRVLRVRVAPGLPADIDRSDFRAGSKFYAAFFSDVCDRLTRIPGVVSVAAVSLGPLDGSSAGFGSLAINGRTVSSDDRVVPVAFVTPEYFATMQIPVIEGRAFTGRDRVGADLVVVVNEAFQRRFAPTGDLLGTRVTSGGGDEAFTVVGVSGDVPDRSLRQGPEPLLIAPLAQMPGVHISWGALTFVVRVAEGDPMRLASAVKGTIWDMNPNVVISELVTMNARVAASMRSEHDSAWLFGLFALTALVMAAVGVYGIAAYTIALRTKEIGIRVALGAARRDVRRLVLAQTLRPTMIGVFVGGGAAALLTPLASAMVYGVTPLDPTTYVIGGAILVLVALTATWVPIRRAFRIDPLVALKYE